MNKTLGVAVIASAMSLSACLGANAAPLATGACVTRAPVAGTAEQPGARNASGEAMQPGARNVSGEANGLGVANHIGGEANPVIPTKTTQFVDGEICAPR